MLRQLVEHGRVSRIPIRKLTVGIPSRKMIASLLRVAVLRKITGKDLSRVDQRAVIVVPSDGVVPRVARNAAIEGDAIVARRYSDVITRRIPDNFTVVIVNYLETGFFRKGLVNIIVTCGPAELLELLNLGQIPVVEGAIQVEAVGNGGGNLGRPQKRVYL